MPVRGVTRSPRSRIMTRVRRDLPSGTVTFLFTDIEGSTRLLAELGSEYADALAEHRRLLREAFRAHGGVEVDTQGDAFFYVFAEAADAVAAAAEAQEALASGPIRVRMGVHTGEPQLTDEGYVGLDVHAGARVAACAHGGQVVLTKHTRDLTDATFRLRDLGEHRLKDLDEVVWVYQLGDDLFPPLKSLSNTNLPVPASSFLGREAELAEAQALLDDTRLLTVSGPGGTGKTRFSIELASRQLDDCPNGVFWVPLAPLRDPALVIEEAARVLGSKDGLAAHIGDKSMLVLFDNFEQVVEAAPTLGDLLRMCPNLRLLVTSRETLRIDGETEFALAPLVEEESVALFCSRARVEPSPAVRELCRRLDGLPLAIELAAARAKVLPPEQLLPRLTERLDLLRGGRDAESRHATLRATIAWSHELLSDEERELFARLGIFAGGCTLEAAEDVCGADLDTLQALLDKSLLRRTGDRYWMLETIREYALGQLADHADAAALESRHTEYFLRFVEEVERHVQSPGEPEWFERLDPEHDNVRAALRHTNAVGDGAVQLRIAVAVAPFRIRRGYLSEGRSDLERALAFPGTPRLRAVALHHAGWIAFLEKQNEDAERLLGQALVTARTLEDDKLTARELLTLAGMVSDRDAYAAQALYDELLDFIANHPPEEQYPSAFVNLADFALQRGDYESARRYSERSLELNRGQGDAWALSLAIANLGLALLGLGEHKGALERFREALRLMESIDDTQGVATMLSVIAAATIELGETERAVRLLASAELALEGTEVGLTGLEHSLHQRTLARAREKCRRFDAEWERGRALTRDEALAEALQEAAKRKA
jgi:predicted ATPase/class 3 adenylate cyclase